MKKIYRIIAVAFLCFFATGMHAQDDGLKRLLNRVDLSKVKIISSDTVSFDRLISHHPDGFPISTNILRRAKPSDGSIDHDNGDNQVVGLDYQYYRYTYPSIDAAGKPVTLSGLMCFPYKTTMGKDYNPRNVIIGCHVTLTSDEEVPYNYYSTGSMTSDVYMLLIHAAYHHPNDAENNLEFRNLIFLPDYEGYGYTKDRSHPYLDEEITARQVVDGVIAGLAAYFKDTYTYHKNIISTATATREIDAGWKMAAVGYSQGGAVAMAVHKFIEENGIADDLHFVGSVCGDGPYDPVATCKKYVDDNKIYMPVTLPLMLKGMLDANPAMSPHRAGDLMSASFIRTGIIDYISGKQMTTKDISKALLNQQGTNITYYKASTGEVLSGSDLSNAKNDGPDAGSVYCKASELLTTNAYNAMKNFKSADADFQNDHTANMDVFKALGSNNITMGWQPKKRMIILHSYGDEVVPYVNCLSAYYSFKNNSNVTFYTYYNTSDPEEMYHTKVGTSFFFKIGLNGLDLNTVSPMGYSLRDLFGQSGDNNVSQIENWQKGVITK